MSKRFSAPLASMNDRALYQILKRGDPATPPTPRELAALETGIMARIADLPVVPAASRMPVWFLPQGLAGRAAAFIALLVVVAGFVVGQVSTVPADAPLLVGGPSLLAFADDALGPSVPATDTAWGDTDDSAE
jgi:hypothetical protein